MKRFNCLKCWRLGAGLTMLAAVLCAGAVSVVAAAGSKAGDSKTPGAKSSNPAKADPKPSKSDPKPKKKRSALTGAELYSINCNRCHAERYPTEFTAAEWKTIMLHMRVRANLPAAQARKILHYLEEDAGN